MILNIRYEIKKHEKIKSELVHEYYDEIFTNAKHFFGNFSGSDIMKSIITPKKSTN